MSVRDFSNEQALDLAPGAGHYRSFVGPAYRYDLLGGSQFSLLFLLGMREHHKLLDFGCGSLRLGRMAIPYLAAGKYFGVEPEAWLIADGLAREIGRDVQEVKRPRFDYNTDYRTDVFGERFDFIIAQSIFSHTGDEATRKALHAFAGSVSDSGLIVANWLIGEETAELAPETCGWVYPECVPFARERVERLAAEAGLAVRFCPWPHGGGLSWFVMARSAEALPSEEELARLAVPPLERP